MRGGENMRHVAIQGWSVKGHPTERWALEQGRTEKGWVSHPLVRGPCPPVHTFTPHREAFQFWIQPPPSPPQCLDRRVLDASC